MVINGWIDGWPYHSIGYGSVCQSYAPDWQINGGDDAKMPLGPYYL